MLFLKKVYFHADDENFSGKYFHLVSCAVSVARL